MGGFGWVAVNHRLCRCGHEYADHFSVGTLGCSRAGCECDCWRKPLPRGIAVIGRRADGSYFSDWWLDQTPKDGCWIVVAHDLTMAEARQRCAEVFADHDWRDANNIAADAELWLVGFGGLTADGFLAGLTKEMG